MTDQNSRPTDENSVDVTFVVRDPEKPTELTLVDKANHTIDEIIFPEGKVYIRFRFPDEKYSNFDIRVFEEPEEGRKVKIMDAYDAGDLNQALERFDRCWEGHASSEEYGYEFILVAQQNNRMVVKDKNLDGDKNALHKFIVKFDYNDGETTQTVLYDPKIRNTGR